MAKKKSKSKSLPSARPDFTPLTGKTAAAARQLHSGQPPGLVLFGELIHAGAVFIRKSPFEQVAGSLVRKFRLAVNEQAAEDFDFARTGGNLG